MFGKKKSDSVDAGGMDYGKKPRTVSDGRDKMTKLNIEQELRDLARRVWALEATNAQTQPAIVFTAYCKEEQKDCQHLSHIANHSRIAIASSCAVGTINYSPRLIRTCLSCGLATWETGDNK